MTFDKFKNYQTEDFVLNDKFIRWVQQPDKKSEEFWNEFLLRFPEKKETTDDARFIILSLKAVEPKVKRGSLRKVKKSLPEIEPRPLVIRTILKVAASIVLLAAIGGLMYYFSGNKPAFPVDMAENNNATVGRIILPDGTVKEFDTKETFINQNPAGEITINNDTIKFETEKSDTKTESLEQVIIPYGMRSQITLSDGTRIWLNSGSQIMYPGTFKGKTREVYLTGEAFFEVKADKNKPFYVIADDMKIKVTGTKFNVSAYNNDPEIHAVLAEGKIEASRNNLFAKNIDLNPGERIVLNKTSHEIITEDVDIEIYTSWINGYLLFEKENINQIFRKLERYYNKKIETSSEMAPVTFSGKLDLNDELTKVFENISFATSLDITNENNIYMIKLTPMK